jgi:hypothetical protein
VFTLSSTGPHILFLDIELAGGASLLIALAKLGVYARNDLSEHTPSWSRTRKQDPSLSSEHSAWDQRPQRGHT